MPPLATVVAEPQPSSPPASRHRASAIVLFVFAACFTALAVVSYRQKSATWDEPIHLTAGYLAAAQGDHRIDPSHPPLLRLWAAVPLLLMDGGRVDTSVIDASRDEQWLGDAYQFATRFLYRGRDADRLLSAARFMVVLWGVALGVLVFLWAREWLGFVPAVAALAFYTIEPNIAAHARLVTTDLAAACCIFGASYWLWRTCRAPTRGNIAGLTICFALAFVTKFSAVLLLPIVAALMVAAFVRGMALRPARAAAIALVLALTTLATIWAAYGFRYEPSPTRGWLLQLQHSSIVQEEAPVLGKVLGWVDAQRVLPNAYTQGFLMSRASARQRAYLAGEYSEDGFWYYFPAVFLLKTPSALVLLLLMGVALLVARRRQFGIENELFVAVPVLVYLAFAVASGINLGLRHLLPIYPFLLLVAAAAARALAAWRRPVGRVALAVLLAYWGVRYADVYPHSLTYMTSFAGGPENGLSYVADSNLDWGQDLKLLKEWMEERGVARINLAYFGTADPAYYGIDGTRLPGTPFARLARPELPGYVAISATILSGVYLEPHWRLFYNEFLDLLPLEQIGNSIYVYHLDRWPEPDDDVAGEGSEGAAVHASLADGLFFELGWPTRAARHYREALERRPDDATMTERLGVALLTGGNASEAIPVLERAAVLDPFDGDTRFRLALALLGAKRPGDAVGHAAAVKLKPRDPSAHDLLGMAYAATGRRAEAEKAFRQALTLAPNHADAREHLRQLQEMGARPAEKGI